ncbi:MAG TPA: YidC/Oxa1 family membrane protein insertase [Anaerolineales bacterium]|nr:YidC/Oxa1 family membrane protein insertase [Anaerolineales bacterium]
MWNTLIVDPMTNALLFIYSILGQNFGLAIILFTLLVRLLTYPLTARQTKSMLALQELQKSEKWQDIQKKYKEDKEKLAQEQMKLYQEAGVNPFGSCLPTLIQFPIIIGLYQSISAALSTTPLQLVALSQRIYPFFPNISTLVPLKSHFLWMDLSQPERLYLPFLPNFGIPLLAVLVVITSYFQTKLMTPTTATDEQSAQMGKMMNLYMPFFMGWIAYSYNAGLAVYFVTSNISTIIQYAIQGKIDLRNLFSFGNKPAETSKKLPASAQTTSKPKASANGKNQPTPQPKTKKNRTQ